MRHLVLALAAALATFPTLAAPPETPVPPAAQIWLALVDEGRYDESWSVASASFHAQIGRLAWERQIGAARDRLGELTSRRLQAENHANSLPGLPPGDYEVLTFRASFSHKTHATEIVTLEWEGDVWKVAGYFIR